MVIARQRAIRFPIRWFTMTQNWRYERMTRGRRREHDRVAARFEA